MTRRLGLLLALALAAADGTTHVSNNGTDTTGCGTELSPCATISHAMTVGDTIFLESGEHAWDGTDQGGGMTVVPSSDTSTVGLVGVGSSSIVSCAGSAGFRLQLGGLNLTSLTLTGCSTTDSSGGGGVFATGTARLMLQDVVIESCSAANGPGTATCLFVWSVLAGVSGIT